MQVIQSIGLSGMKAVLALQGIFDASTIWILIPLTALAIPIVAILTGPMNLRMKQRERKEARETYERIVREKLDVIRTAVAMGYAKDDIDDLDRRLEKLIGADKLKSLLDQKQQAAPEVEGNLLDTDLEMEVLQNRSRKKIKE